MRKIVVALVVALGTFFLASTLFNPQQATLLGLVALLVTLWTNEALPLGVVSLLPLLLFSAFEIVELKALSQNYAKPIIFLFLGGFLLAIALQKLGLHRYLAIKLLAIFPKTPTGIIYALMFTSALLSSVLSNTTITLMLLPIALFLSENMKLKVRFLLATAYGASIGGIFTPIGTAPNMLLLGFLEEMSLKAPSFLEWMFLTAPVVGIMLLIVPLILSVGIKDEEIGYRHEQLEPLSSQQKKLFVILSSLVLLLVFNAPLKPYYEGFGLNEKMILLGFGLLLFLPSIDILEWKDSKEIPYEIILLFGAGFSIASAFIQTGLAKDMATYLQHIGHLNLFLILFLISLFVSFSTEITSNTALTSIAIPVIYEFAKEASLPIELVLLVGATSASYAFMLPIATPPNAIVMSSRVIKIKQMAKIGFFINILGVVVLSSIALLFWRGYLWKSTLARWKKSPLASRTEET